MNDLQTPNTSHTEHAFDRLYQSQSPHPVQGFELAASIVETLCSLPTIPTKSWCDTAAAAVGGLFKCSASVVVVCTTLTDGSIRRIHGLGVAVRSGGEDPSQPAKAQSGTNPAGSVSQDRDQLDGELRCGLEGMMHLGWSPIDLALDQAEIRFTEVSGALGVPELVRCVPGVDGGAGGGAQGGAGLTVEAEGSLPTTSLRSPATEPWHQSSPFAVFVPARTTRVVAGIASIGAPELGRRIAVYVGDLGADQSSTAMCADVLSACLPLVARKASLALDRTWTDKGRWLSNREKLVLEQLIIGRSVPEIAAVLQRSHHTVHDNVKSLHRKLAASTRGELIARALGIGGRVMDSDSEATD